MGTYPIRLLSAVRLPILDLTKKRRISLFQFYQIGFGEMIAIVLVFAIFADKPWEIRARDSAWPVERSADSVDQGRAARPRVKDSLERIADSIREDDANEVLRLLGQYLNETSRELRSLRSEVQTLTAKTNSNSNSVSSVKTRVTNLENGQIRCQSYTAGLSSKKYTYTFDPPFASTPKYTVSVRSSDARTDAYRVDYS